MELVGVLEGLLFVVGDEGISKDRLLDILKIEESKLNFLIEQLVEKYDSIDSGLNIEKFADKLKLTTKKEHKSYYENLVEVEKNSELTPSALETLAVIAYNSPTTRAHIDSIRGLDSTYQIRKLLYRNLIKEAGRSDLPGRPILYSVTDEFLDYLGLSSLSDLPKLEEPENVEIDDTDLYESRYSEENI